MTNLSSHLVLRVFFCRRSPLLCLRICFCNAILIDLIFKWQLSVLEDALRFSLNDFSQGCRKTVNDPACISRSKTTLKYFKWVLSP